MGTWATLTRDVLTVVFAEAGKMDARALLAIPLVCKEWRDVCKEEFTVDIDAAWAKATLTKERLVGLCSPFHIVRSLKLQKCGQVTDEWLKAVAFGCPNMNNINLSRCNKVTDEGVKAVAL